MPSAQLVLAAQTNGKKSRGPKTPEGKRKSSANSRKHGLYAKTFHPDPLFHADLDRFLAAFQSEYSPATPRQQDLVRVAAISLARANWAQRLALQILNNQLKKDQAPGIPVTPARYSDAAKANTTAIDKAYILENRCYKLWRSAIDRLTKSRERTESEDTTYTENRRNEPNSPTSSQPAASEPDTINQHQMRSLSLSFALLIPLAGALNAQNPPPPLSIPGAQPAPTQKTAEPAPTQQANEVGTNDASITFQSKVNLVLVPVVVRDKNGKPVDGLTKEDFNLFDKGKPQTISRFSVEKASLKIAPPAPKLEKTPDDAKTGDAAAPDMVVPSHFVAWLFDDIHLNTSDLIQARNAAQKYLAEGLKDTDRAAIYTTSGQTSIDFTDNLNQLRDGLAQLRPRPVARATAQQCPDISYYMADQIVNKNDPIALVTAEQETYACMNFGPPQTLADTKPIVQSSAYQTLEAGRQETRIALGTLKDLVRRMGAMPGTRLIVMVSPGFLRLDEQLQDESDVIDRAIKANVTISALDARGLYTDTPDITKQVYSAAATASHQQYDRAAARADSDVLAEFADATGGTFFENNNDLARGMKELAAVPDVYYILAFSPQNLKLDGSYHNLKITLRTPNHLSAKGRRGYYAPRHLTDADQEAKEEISQALFSREEMRDIPVDFHTQFFKASAFDARLVVVARLDVRKLHYRKIDGRNGDEVLVVAGLFDRNGNFVNSVAKTIKMRLKDDTLAEKLNSGISIRSDFKVAPGRYVVRLVVRDAEGQMMAAQNGAVEIP